MRGRNGQAYTKSLQMLDVFSSPGDPLFYLHHAWIDKLWTDWQSQDRAPRLRDMGGTNQGFPITFPGNGTFPPFPGPPGNGTCFPGGFPGGAFPGGFFGPPIGPGDPLFRKKEGDSANVTTLGHVLTSYEAIPNVTVSDVMDVQGGYLCYEYV